MFVCIQNPIIDIDTTCYQEILKECVSTMRETNLKLAELPNVYSTGFCTTKNIEFY